MSPFDLPPSGAPVSMPPPDIDGGSRPRRGRMALVAVLTAGVIGGGIAGISQFASADPPELGAAATDRAVPPPDDATDDATDDGTAEDVTDEPTADEPPADAETGDDAPSVDGEIVLELGDDDPIVLDLGDLGDGSLAKLQECLGLPVFDVDLDVGDWQPGDGPFGNLDDLFGDVFENLPPLEEFDWQPGDGPFGGSVTVSGPDGVSVVDLGENGSVTITKDGDDVTVETSGDATVQDLADVFGEFGRIFDGEFGGELEGRLDDLFEQFDEGAFDDLVEGLPTFDELPEFPRIDPDQVEACLAELE